MKPLAAALAPLVSVVPVAREAQRRIVTNDAVPLPSQLVPRTGKSGRAPLRVGEDVQAAARATISISASGDRHGTRAMARAFLDPNAVK